ncbi:hypothetical protein [Embleya scabrispora]|uniref:hypothetical protein n=1 Tax=Embleya scabrispora TaxID=159449 RepID=UPI00036BA255|nr:hypothetical protein [Embleya scabrispora]MYS84749.1 hypothetical protein [Streptomyces sp. SID5474]
MTADVAQPASVRELLFGDDSEVAAASLVDAAREHEVAAMLGRGSRSLTGAAGQTVEREVASMVNNFLSLDLLDLAAAGWAKHAAMVEAARRTRAAPETEEVVALATHRITSTHRPCVDLTVDGARVGSLEICLTVAFDIEGMLAVIRRAHLTSLRCGTCTTTGTLAMQQAVVASRRCSLDLPGAMQLRSGIALLPAAQDPTPPQAPPGQA